MLFVVSIYLVLILLKIGTNTRLPVSKVLFSSDNQTWGTPPKIFKELSDEFGPFQLDAATRESNPLKTPYFYTIKDDGLKQDWMNPTYVNPPFGRELYLWVKKASEESKKGNRVVMLIPSRTDTRWFHEFVYNKPNVEYRFVKGRLTMVNYDDLSKKFNPAPFPSLIIIFNPYSFSSIV